MRLLDLVNRSAEYLVSALLLLATLSIVLQVLVRFLLDSFGFMSSFPWTEEVCRYTMTWVVFLGVAVLSRKGRLIAVDILLHRLPARLALVLELAALCVTIVFFGLFGYLGYVMAANGLAATSPVMQINMALVYSAVPVAAVLTIVNLLALICERIARPDFRLTATMEE